MRNYKNYLALFFAIVALTFVTVNAQSSGDSRTLEQRIYKRILGVTDYGIFDNITFELQGSTVTLHGKVYSLGTIGQAEREVKKLPGVETVIDQIEQLPASPSDDEIRKRAFVAFVNSGASQYFATPRPEVRIIVENGRLTLEGHVNNQAHSDSLNVLAHGIQGVLSVQNNLIVGEDTLR